MIYLIDPKNPGGEKCTLFCKGIAWPMYGVPTCYDVWYK